MKKIIFIALLFCSCRKDMFVNNISTSHTNSYVEEVGFKFFDTLQMSDIGHRYSMMASRTFHDNGDFVFIKDPDYGTLHWDINFIK